MTTNNNFKSSVKVIGNIICFIGIIICIALIAFTCMKYFRKKETPRLYTNFEMIPNTKEISFNPDEPASYAQYIEPLNQIMLRNEDYTPKGNKIHCSEKPNKTDDEVCIISPPMFDGCKNDNWGFSISKPCFLMTYRNDSSFNPQPYTNSNELLLNENVPKSFKNIINDEIEDREEGFDKELIRVFCNHTNYESYFPYQGFKAYFFPNNDDLPNYEPPLVGVVFDMTKEKQLNVQCGIWDKSSSSSSVIPISFKITNTKNFPPKL